MLIMENYIKQARQWLVSAKHILAQYDADTIVVYQAYRPAIGDFTIEYQRFGGEFSYSRMSDNNNILVKRNV